MKTLKVGTMPGVLSEVVVETGMTVGQVIELAGLNATGYELKLDGVSVTSEMTIGANSNLLVLVKQIKGNAQTLKVGTMPGVLTELVYEPYMTVKQVLELANLNPSGYEIKLDGVTVGLDTVIQLNANLLVLVKQIKGNLGGNTMQTIKVGQMPGLLKELVVQSGMTVGEVLALAELSATGYEIKLDGVTVAESATLSSTSALLVLVKQIKGNMQTIKVGQMPGLLKEVVVEPGATVESILALAELDANGYEIKLDGVTVSPQTTISSTSALLVLVKQIKGNDNK
jgi:putative ubiquitin-RnfH superfamily antitoxin RatB of RatAB toxin-antitoxin module